MTRKPGKHYLKSRMIVDKIFARKFVGDGENDFQIPRQHQCFGPFCLMFCFESCAENSVFSLLVLSV